MNYSLIISTMLMLTLHGTSLANPPAALNIAAIRTELIQMLNDDQGVRHGTINMAKMWDVDAKNLKQLKKIITLIGWPTKKLVGEKASQGAFLVAQHAANDLPFMEEALAYIEAEYKQKQVPALHYAMLYDRVEILHSRPQKYGTQFSSSDDACKPLPLSQPAKVDEFRAQLGLDSFAAAMRRACG